MEKITGFLSQLFSDPMGAIKGVFSSISSAFGFGGGDRGTVANTPASAPEPTATSTSTDTGRTVYSGPASSPAPAAKEGCGWDVMCNLKKVGDMIGLGGAFRGAVRLPDGGEIVKNPNNARIVLPGGWGISTNRGRTSVGGPNGGISF